MPGKLYLIPNTLGESSPEDVIPSTVLAVIRELDHFIVENVRNARRFIIKCGYKKSIDDIVFYELNKHTRKAEISGFLDDCLSGNDMGIISEAGVPGVADPGAEVTSVAHRKGIRIVPLVGPSSILLSLMASGLNGQDFRFAGYLPVKGPERIKKLKELETAAMRSRQTQVFIETPYRNNAMVEDILKACHPDLRLCIACDISLETEYIRTMPVKEWKKIKKPDLHKRPAIFLIGSS